MTGYHKHFYICFSGERRTEPSQVQKMAIRMNDGQTTDDERFWLNHTRFSRLFTYLLHKFVDLEYRMRNYNQLCLNIPVLKSKLFSKTI